MNNPPFSREFIEKITQKHPTPFHIYDEKSIRKNIQRLYEAFGWVPGFKEYFAVKANPNPYLIEILKEEGCGADCSSLAELILSEKVGITGEDIMFTSNDTPIKDFQKAAELGAIINFDDISHISFYEKNIEPLPELACCRYNPGALKKGNAIIGNPEEAKYGFTKEQLFAGYKLMKEKGVKRFGLHTMVASNELNPEYFVETFQILLALMVEIEKEVGISFEFLNIGGGIGIPYRPDDEAVNLEQVSEGIKRIYENHFGTEKPLKIVMEMGRMVTGPYGWLVTQAIHKKDTYKKYIGTDACMANLMRPALYGAYHHITVLGKEDAPSVQTYDVTGSLCENNDKFAIDRSLPEVEIGDFLAIHDAGAHGYAMGFNYNGKLRSAELLLQKDGNIKQIRRAETVQDYFATLDYPGL